MNPPLTHRLNKAVLADAQPHGPTIPPRFQVIALSVDRAAAQALARAYSESYSCTTQVWIEWGTDDPRHLDTYHPPKSGKARRKSRKEVQS